MRFIVGESVDARLAPFLRSLHHDVTVVGTPLDYPASIPDDDVLAIAYAEQRILITDDRDFGELIFRLGRPHAGVLYFRLPPTEIEVKQHRLAYVMNRHADSLGHFLVVTLRAVRIRRE
jgi:predicted nuclease of predicted toxin-antitoxin system